MHSNVSLSDGQKNLALILKELGDKPIDWNEANTRFHIIDRLLIECLGWPKDPDNFVVEKHADGEYQDYVLGTPASVIWIKELKPYIMGWRGYFGFCQTPRVLTNLEAWIRRRLRLYLWRQWRTGQNRFAELRHRGISKFNAAVAAGSPTGLWRMSGHPSVQQALRNRYFESLGLPRIHAPAQA